MNDATIIDAQCAATGDADRLGRALPRKDAALMATDPPGHPGQKPSPSRGSRENHGKAASTHVTVFTSEE